MHWILNNLLEVQSLKKIALNVQTDLVVLMFITATLQIIFLSFYIS